MKCLRVILGAGLLFTGACGDIPAGDEAIGGTDQPITGGNVFASQSAPDTSVVKIQWSNAVSTNTCTALKVSSNTFWTAGHCLDSVVPGTTVFNVTDRLDGAFVGLSSYRSTVFSIDVHPSRRNWFNAISQPSRPGRDWHYDVGRFTLSDSTPNIRSYVLTNSTWMAPGQKVTYTGYGCDRIQPAHDGQKQWASFTLSDFPVLRDKMAASAYEIYPHAMVTVADNPQGCPGDSGSPVFKFVDGAWRTLGIASYGGNGWTGMQRFSNVEPWLKGPAFNSFGVGFKGSLLNQISGHCVSYGFEGKALEATCDLRNPAFSDRTWILSNSGGPANTFYIVNAANQSCLDLETTAESSNLVLRTCLPTNQANNTQRWRFDTTRHGDYRTLVNHQTGRCTAPSTPNDENSVLKSTTCVTFEPGWRNQAWMMVK